MEDEVKKIEDRLNAMGQKADIIPMRFIEPGLVNYDDVGTVLIKKETLDKMANSFVGRPVFNEQHKDVTSKDFSSGLADGVVTRVWYEPADAWFWADVAVWDSETKKNCRNGYSLSCAYDVKKWSDSGGIHNNIPYAREIMDGEYTHLAIVPNPRYEGARIIYNSNGGNMKFAFWKKEGDKPEVKNSSEIDGDKAVLTIDGKDVPMSELVSLWNSQEKQKAVEEAEAILKTASDESSIEIGGKRVTLGELKNAFLANTMTDEEKAKKKKEDEKENDDEDDDKKKKKDKDDEKENDDEDDDEEKKKKKKEEEEEEAKKKKENAAHFKRVQELANSRNGNFEAPKVMTPAEKIAEGNKRYGSAKV